MSDEREDPGEPSSFVEGLRALHEKAAAQLADHPPVEVLIAYCEGRSPAAEQETVRDHLTLCSECRELVLDAGRFRELGGDAEAPPAGGDPELAWEALRARLAAEPAAPGAAPGAPLRALPRPHPRRD